MKNIPLLFNSIEPESFPTEWEWLSSKIGKDNGIKPGLLTNTTMNKKLKPGFILIIVWFIARNSALVAQSALPLSSLRYEWLEPYRITHKHCKHYRWRSGSECHKLVQDLPV